MLRHIGGYDDVDADHDAGFRGRRLRLLDGQCRQQRLVSRTPLQSLDKALTHAAVSNARNCWCPAVTTYDERRFEHAGG
jgi:hypothetical protein